MCFSLRKTPYFILLSIIHECFLFDVSVRKKAASGRGVSRKNPRQRGKKDSLRTQDSPAVITATTTTRKTVCLKAVVGSRTSRTRMRRKSPIRHPKMILFQRFWMSKYRNFFSKLFSRISHCSCGKETCSFNPQAVGVSFTHLGRGFSAIP